MKRLYRLFADLPSPPDPFGLYPRYGELRLCFQAAMKGSDPEALETAFLTLYAHVHGYEAPCTPEELRIKSEAGGYLNHVGGISPVIKALPFIEPSTVSADFGAGNGLQGLLIQKLRPHRKTVQIEISGQLIEAGKVLQTWLGVEKERVEWIHGDVADTSPRGFDFIYIYRPVRPSGKGRVFYEGFAADLAAQKKKTILFSVADCLGPLLPATFERFYSDGHLTCFCRK